MKCIAGSGITQEGIDLHEAEGLYATVQTRDSELCISMRISDSVLLIYIHE